MAVRRVVVPYDGAVAGRQILAAGSMLDQPAETVIDAAAAAGFDGVGLRLSGEHHTERPSELRRRATGGGITVFDAEVYRVSSAAENPEPLLDAAVAAGAEAVLAVSDVDDRTATVVALRSLAAECAERGLRLGLEYMAWTMPSDPTDAISIADDVGCELIVDLLHHVRVGAGVDELDAIVRSGHLGWVQLCDAPLARPGHEFQGSASHDALVHEARHGRLVPGRGELPLTALLERLPTDVLVSVEVQSDALAVLGAFERARLLHDASRSVLGG